MTDSVGDCAKRTLLKADRTSQELPPLLKTI